MRVMRADCSCRRADTAGKGLRGDFAVGALVGQVDLGIGDIGARQRQIGRGAQPRLHQTARRADSFLLRAKRVLIFGLHQPAGAVADVASGHRRRKRDVRPRESQLLRPRPCPISPGRIVQPAIDVDFPFGIDQGRAGLAALGRG